MKPREIAAGLRDLRQAVGRQINDGERLRQPAQSRHQLRTFFLDRLGADDQRQPVVGTFGFAAELGQIMEANGCEIQKLQ